MFGDVGVTVIAILNAMRALMIRPENAEDAGTSQTGALQTGTSQIAASHEDSAGSATAHA